MAYYRNSHSSGRYGKRRGRGEVERLAFKMGIVEQGKKNPESRVYESFGAGLKASTNRTKKPLI